MEKLDKKLHSQAGASMVLSLLFLLFCLMVGAVILTAASTNAGRVNHNRDDQKKELAVESAALLLRDDLADLTLVGKYIWTHIDSTEISYEPLESGEMQRVETPLPSADTSDAQMPAALTGTKLTAFPQLQEDMTNLLFSQVTTLSTPVIKPESMRYALEFDGASMPTVQAALRVELDGANAFAITATLRVKEDGSHPMTLRLLGQASGWQAVASPPESAFTPTGGEGAYISGISTVTTRTTYTQTIRWMLPEITKGASE